MSTNLSARAASDALLESSTSPNVSRRGVRVALRPCVLLRSNHSHNNDHDDDEPGDDSIDDVRRFVTALTNHPSIRVVTFANSRFFFGSGRRNDIEGAEEEEEDRAKRATTRRSRVEEEELMDELFGSVLSRHQTLHTIVFSNCEGIRSTNLRALLSPTSSLRSLSLYDCLLLDDDPPATTVISQALSSNSPLKELHLVRCGLTTDQCRSIFVGASRSISLRSLSVVEPNRLRLDANTLANILGTGASSSMLQTVRVGARVWTEDGVTELAKQLKANETLESLDVSSSSSRRIHDYAIPYQPFVDVLTTYNSTLRYLRLPDADLATTSVTTRSVLDRLLDRNVRITSYYTRLMEDPVPRIVVDGKGRHLLWPESIGRLSGSFPTLLYRLVRRNGPALVEECGVRRQNPVQRRVRVKRKVHDSTSEDGRTGDGDPEPKRSRRRCRRLSTNQCRSEVKAKSSSRGGNDAIQDVFCFFS